MFVSEPPSSMIGEPSPLKLTPFPAGVYLPIQVGSTPPLATRSCLSALSKTTPETPAPKVLPASLPSM